MPPEKPALITACTLNCPDACSLQVVPEAGNQFRVRGNPHHPFTAGFACCKLRRHLDRLRSPHRILSPLRKVAGTWQPISWKDALDLCAEKIQACRREPASILHIHSDGAKGVLKEATELFFDHLGTSRLRGSLCDAAGYIAFVKDFGSRDNHRLEDLGNARRIVNWGKDLSRSSVHIAALVGRARRQGTAVITISPGGDGNRPFSDQRVRIRPGADRFLAAAVVRLLIERGAIRPEITDRAKNWAPFRALIDSTPLDRLLAACEVPRSEAEKLCDCYGDPAPTATLIGAGLQRYAYGGENVRFINALAFVSGNIGRSGGGSYFHLHALRNLNLDWTRAPESAPRRSLRLPLIGRELLEADHPPIRMIWVNGSNVVNQAPDSRQTARAFEQVAFKVVVDAFMTDTALRADLILPSALMLEQEDLVASFYHDYIHYVTAVLPPPGEARTDFQILSDLGRRLDPPVVLPTSEACLRASLKRPGIDVSLETLRSVKFSRVPRPAVAYPGMRFAHGDGKCRLPTSLHAEPPAPPEFPLRLLTLVRRDTLHSQLVPGEQKIPPKVWVGADNPVLQKLDLSREIRLVSRRGEIKVKLELSNDLHHGTVIYRRGDWMQEGGGANQLIVAATTDMGQGAAFYDAYVRLENIPAETEPLGIPPNGG